MSETEKISVLVVDDDADCRALVSAVLLNGGYQVEQAADGQEALEVLAEFKPAVIVLDVMMPRLNGYEVLMHLKQRPETQNIPVVMLTAKGEDEDLLRGYGEYQVDYYITKPFTSRQLLAGLKLVL